MIESRRSLALQTAAFLLVLLFVVIVVPTLLAGQVAAADPTGGIDGPLTPPPTATMPAAARPDTGWLPVAVLAGSGAVGLLVTLRRVRR